MSPALTAGLFTTSASWEAYELLHIAFQKGFTVRSGSFVSE